MSNVSAAQKTPWCAQTTLAYFSISFDVATAISRPPGTIHFTTPMPSGKITGHSVIVFQRARVKSRSLSGTTYVIAMRFAGWAW